MSHSHNGVTSIDGQPCLNFASNDYLGLSQNQEVLQSYVEGLAQYGAGAGASSVVSGYIKPHYELENLICELFNKPAALLFSSGFAANQAIVAALFANGHNDDAIVCDKLMHASFIDSALAQKAKLLRFKHNDLNHLSSKLKLASGNTLVATEGVFSMDGDMGELAAIAKLATVRAPKLDSFTTQKSVHSVHTMLMVDDAHGFGVVGKNGLGVCDLDEVEPNDIDVIMATFGKAIGTAGAFVACSEALADYFVNFAKHYIYSTAVGPAQALASIKSIQIMQQSHLRERLHENIAHFRTLALEHDLPLLRHKRRDANTATAAGAQALGATINTSEYSSSAIQPILIRPQNDSGGISQENLCVRASKALMALGIFVPAIRTPTVPKGMERLRVTLSAVHTKKDIEALIDALCISRTQLGW
ncbi:aminotransferase class I/II-fold pyridoxal phosphate-dependent enzyme [Ningiella sp. W23]|uniref:aminotransferase class I/II-fold pyridoxal phosphate-dependent enzyme n=1 Tax=Ningiella sp. W23 TaxID=3023715 RepID=UPI0037564C71